MSGGGEDAFLTAYAAASRGARLRYAKKFPNVEGATEAFMRLPLLLSDDLRLTALTALAGGLGPTVDGDTPFPGAIWYGGVHDVGPDDQGKIRKHVQPADVDEDEDGRYDTPWGGVHLRLSIAGFVEHVLVARSTVTRKKFDGWVVEPVTNPSLRRTKEATLEMHAVFLDADEVGGADPLLAVLRAMGIAHIYHQSGGWTEDKPKWRLILPLSHPRSVRTTAERDAWRRSYLACRVVFGALGRLLGHGFDPATDGPAAPFFVTEKRARKAPPRRVSWAPGASLDLDGLLAGLPALPPLEKTAGAAGARAPAAPAGALDDAHLTAIVTALAAVTSQVPRGRRDLYLALPGVLLDRGVEPDDVRTICEEVSARYPRRDDKKHQDNVRCASTTIAKWESDGVVTRIGTLNDLWPEVAKVVDRVVPDPLVAETRAVLDQIARNKKAGTPTARAFDVPAVVPPPAHVADVPPIVAPTATEPTTPQKPLSRRAQHVVRLRALASRKMSSDKHDDKIRGFMLKCLLDGEDFLPRHASGAVASLGGEPLTRDRAVAVVMGMVAFRLPSGTPFDEDLASIARGSLFKMLGPGEHTSQLVEQAERAFLVAVNKKTTLVQQKNAEIVAHDRAGLA